MRVSVTRTVLVRRSDRIIPERRLQHDTDRKCLILLNRLKNSGELSEYRREYDEKKKAFEKKTGFPPTNRSISMSRFYTAVANIRISARRYPKTFFR